MTDAAMIESIARQRYHGLYLSRRCEDLAELSRELLGLHCWFHRNVAFSALIRGADIAGWKDALTKTWLYRGTLHGVDYDDLPRMLALHKGESWIRRMYGQEMTERIAEDVTRCMEDGIYSRAQMRKIFADVYEPQVIEVIFSSWGGIFAHLAGLGKVAFRDMTSRDFDLIGAEPTHTAAEVLPDLLRRYFGAYGPATLDDAAWFFGFLTDKTILRGVNLEEYERLELGGKVYYHCGEPEGMGDIPEVNLLSGFDPIVVSYTERGAVLPVEYKGRVILKSGICLPTIAVHGKIAGLWNIKKNAPVVEFFEEQPKRIADEVWDRAESLRRGTAGRI